MAILCMKHLRNIWGMLLVLWGLWLAQVHNSRWHRGGCWNAVTTQWRCKQIGEVSQGTASGFALRCLRLKVRVYFWSKVENQRTYGRRGFHAIVFVLQIPGCCHSS